jgi:pyruvate/2-oxoglutarate dehydrogenase complex dihydrolipoamide acyltransferase (E2) component
MLLTMSTKRKNSFSLSWIPCHRWNVLDMVEILGRASIPTPLFFDIDFSWAEELRAKLKQLGYRITITSILLKAIALAQRNHPCTRSAHTPWGQVLHLNDIVAGFTVEKFIDSEPAVFFGLIKDPDIKSLIQISVEVNQYATCEPAQIPQLNLEELFSHLPWLFRRIIIALGLIFPAVRLRYLGATFGFSSLGKSGVKMVIPPSVCAVTFGMGEVEARPVVRNGKIEIRPMASIVLNFDHRLLDGAPAARFMHEVKELLEGGLEPIIEEELKEASLLRQSQPESAYPVIGF